MSTYKIARNLNKYTRKLKGKETIEAKVDLDFSKEIGGVFESLNGTSRNETDAILEGSLERLMIFY
jgi:hypothetical protein